MATIALALSNGAIAGANSNIFQVDCSASGHKIYQYSQGFTDPHDYGNYSVWYQPKMATIWIRQLPNPTSQYETRNIGVGQPAGNTDYTRWRGRATDSGETIIKYTPTSIAYYELCTCGTGM